MSLIKASNSLTGLMKIYICFKKIQEDLLGVLCDRGR